MRETDLIKVADARRASEGATPWAPMPPPGAWRWRLPFVVGVLVGLAGAIGAGATLTAPHLPQQMIGSATPGMVHTATGDGAAQPTNTLSTSQLAGVQGSGYVPVTPTLYLPNAVVNSTGSKESALWEVWWDPNTQVTAAVCLQSHLNNSDAATAVSDLQSKDADYAALDNGTYNFTSGSQFSLPGISGGTGYLWQGLEQLGGTAVPIEYRFAVFSRGSVVALVSMTAFNGQTDATSFQDLASAEYSQMAQLNLASALIFIFLFLAGIGLCVLANVKRNKWNKQLAATYGRPFPVPGAAGYGPAPYGGYPGYPPANWPPPYPGVTYPPTYPYPAYPAHPSAPAYPAPYAAPSYWPPPSVPPPPVQRPAGWYEDPDRPAGDVQLRYFDGRSWTPSTARPPAAAPQAGAPATSPATPPVVPED